MTAIQSVEVLPIGAPPTGFGGDARNVAQGGPTYANAVLEILTDQPDLKGTSIVFTNGHGLLEMCALIRRVATRFLLDKSAPVEVDHLRRGGHLGTFSRMMLRDSDYSWLGGVGPSRMAIGAVVNALWDLTAKLQQLPAWQLIAEMSPEELIEFVDFEQIEDVVSPQQALEIFTSAQAGKQQRIFDILENGLLAYNTAGWSGIGLDGLVAQTRKMIADGWPQIKIKVGATYSAARMQADREGRVLDRNAIDELARRAADEDAERMILVYATIAREDSRARKMKVAADSNQIFDPRSAIVYIKRLAEKIYQADPSYTIEWFEEPTSQHSAAGHIYIQHALNREFRDYDPPLHVPISTGEQGAAPVVFKDLLHAPAIDGTNEKRAIDVIQMDYARVAGIGDNLAILLLAVKARREGRDVRICPHAGGIGLCEGMRNVQAIKQALFGSANNAGVEDIIEFVAEVDRSVHGGVFENPAIVKNGRYQMSAMPGVGVDYTAQGKKDYLLPDGNAWKATREYTQLARKFMLQA
ncbi:MAG: enolase C-terminal domain-like protein [Desulfosarcinaceae bacterium]